jgi:predicted Zn-dependent protease
MTFSRPSSAALLCLVALLTGCAPPAPTKAFVEQAARLHNEALAPVAATDTDLNEYFQILGQRLMDGAHSAAPQKTRAAFFSDLQTHLVATPIPNAFVTGGSHVYIYNGLFQACLTEEELAAAMAHAFAHTINLDVEKVKIRPAPERGLRYVAFDFVDHRFTLQQERDAHELAFQIYVHAGYNPEHFENVFQVLADRYPAAMPDRLPLPVRATEARAWAAKADQKWRKPTVADRATFTSLKKKAAALHEPAGDGSLMLRAFPNCVLSADTSDQLAAQAALRPVQPNKVEIEPN